MTMDSRPQSCRDQKPSRPRECHANSGSMMHRGLNGGRDMWAGDKDSGAL